MAELKKTIGAWRGTAMMLNIVLGAGLLTLPGLAMKEAGDAALLVWLACAAASIPLLYVFAIIGREHPDAGGIATLIRKGLGDMGYVPAVLLFLGAVAVGLPSIALTGGHYAASVFGGSADTYALVLILAAFAVNLLSPERASGLNAALASVVVGFLIAIAVVGWATVKPDLTSITVVPAKMPEFSTFTLAFMMVFFAFTGWEVAANLSGEFQNPRRDFPLAMGLSFVVALTLYLVLAVLVAAYGPGAANAAPFTAILGASFGAWGEIPVGIVATLLVFANLTAAVWAVSRMVCSAGRDGVLPGKLATVSKGVPSNAVGLTGAVLISVVFASMFGWVHLEELLAAAGQNFILLYAGAALALLRLTSKSEHRILALLSLALVALIVSGRGLEGIVYPAGLAGLGLAIAFCRNGTIRAFRRLNKEPSC
ncbi:MAG: amino acid permease [Pseudomonadota bacterium]